MSNKPNSLKQKDFQIGNFIISKEGTGEIKFIKVRSNSWNMKWRSDSEFYQLVEDMIKPEAHAYFHNFIASCYAMSNGIKDNIFLEGFARLWQEQNERYLAVKPTISEVENQQIINEEKEKNDSSNKI